MTMIYTIGYQGWTLLQVATARAYHNATLVDIRYNPTSMRPEWRREALREAIPHYQHLPALGNRTYREGYITLAAPERAVEPVRRLLEQGPIILLCACRDWRICHRQQAAAYLAEQLGVTVEHLEPPAKEAPEGMVMVLTLQQPWAWALFYAGKDVENRTWHVPYRGRLYIHTSQKVPKGDYYAACAEIQRIAGMMPPRYESVHHGAVIGSVEATDCVTESNSPWFFGPHGLLVREPRLLGKPVPARGALGLWHWGPPQGIIL